MKKAFLKFMEHVVSVDCPFYPFSVSIYRTFIEVKFVTKCSVKPGDLGWLNTHLIGGRWFIISENDSIAVIVRFEADND